MFYRGFDGLLLRERFLEGNDTHEIKLILAVSRNAMHKESKKFYCGRKRLADEGLGADYGERCGHERGVATRGVGPQVLRVRRVLNKGLRAESKGGMRT